MTKTNIKISKYVRDELEEIEGGTFDSKLNTLMNNVEPLMPFIDCNDERTNIQTTKETLERLDKFRITANESRDNILTRMLITLDEINNTGSAEEWIPFKLTNPYNNLLVIDGQIEYSSRELSFNYRGNLYRNKLPSNYIVDGKDLTKELYLWYDNLDWQKIEKQIIDNVDIPFSTIEKDYILEVNVILKKE